RLSQISPPVIFLTQLVHFPPLHGNADQGPLKMPLSTDNRKQSRKHIAHILKSLLFGSLYSRKAQMRTSEPTFFEVSPSEDPTASITTHLGTKHSIGTPPISHLQPAGEMSLSPSPDIVSFIFKLTVSSSVASASLFRSEVLLGQSVQAATLKTPHISTLDH
ncbi:hypothetical protein STEG23_000519, partial [Scotinomys teguina]